MLKGSKYGWIFLSSLRDGWPSPFYPKEKVCVGQTEFPLPKESQLESTAFSINIYPLAFLPLELFFPK